MPTVDEWLDSVGRMIAERQANDTIHRVLHRPRSADEIVAGIFASAERDVERRQDVAEAYHVTHPLLSGYHEAGHAIVADAYGMDLIGVWADPSTDRATQGQTDYFLWGSTDLARVESAVVALAGKVGERMCPAWRPDQELVTGHHDDHDQARAVLGDDPAVIRALEDQARGILTERAGALEHLAELLVRRGDRGVKGPELEFFLNAPHRPGPGGEVVTLRQRDGSHLHWYANEHRPADASTEYVRCWPGCLAAEQDRVAA